MTKINQSKTFFICIITLGLLFTACKKDTPKTTYKIQGLWVGTVANSTSTAQPYSLSIKADGKITFEGLAGNVIHFGTGTWTLTGNSFVANVTTLYGISSNVGTQQRLTATFNSTDGTLTNGAYVNVSPANDNGVIVLTKVN